MTFAEFNALVTGKTISATEPGFTPGWVVIHFTDGSYITLPCGSTPVGYHYPCDYEDFAEFFWDERWIRCEREGCGNQAVQDCPQNRANGFDVTRCSIHQHKTPLEKFLAEEAV